MFRLRKKIKLDYPVTLEAGDTMEVWHRVTDEKSGVVVKDELLVEDFVQEGEGETYTHALVIDFEDELDMKKGYMGGVGREE